MKTAAYCYLMLIASLVLTGTQGFCQDDTPEPDSHIRPQRQPFQGGGLRAPEPKGKPSVSPMAGPPSPDVDNALARSFNFEESRLRLPELTDNFYDFMERMTGDQMTLYTKDDMAGKSLYKGNVRFVGQDGTVLTCDKCIVDENERSVAASGHVKITQKEGFIEADTLNYNPSSIDGTDTSENRGRLTGTNVYIEEPERQLHARTFSYDLARDKGELQDTRGRTGIFYFGAQKVDILGKDDVDAEKLWITTCDKERPHYRVRMKKGAIRSSKPASGTGAQLQIANKNTPIYWPKWRSGDDGGLTSQVDFESGRHAETGLYFNFGQRFQVTPNIEAGYRLYPTEHEGTGAGPELEYHFDEESGAFLRRSHGELLSLYTTEDRGYLEYRHRQELTDRTTLWLQSEQWSDQTFYKDFYFDEYQDRTGPRTFGHILHRWDNFIATGTARFATHSFTTETERLPEGTFHVLERPIAKNLYLTFDTINGYNKREPFGSEGTRSVNVGRLTYDINAGPGLNIAPFYEMETTWYERDRRGDKNAYRFSNTVGVTAQSRFHRSFKGAFGFSGFKHVVIPSVTYSYRPEPTMDIEDSPHYDAYDRVYGRSRVETKIDNIFFGRDAKTKQTWQVGRLTLYQGNDFWNELRDSEDYEIEMDVRPRPWWGVFTVFERHHVGNATDIDPPTLRKDYEDFDKTLYEYDSQYGDFTRFYSHLYVNDPTDRRYGARLGFSYAETEEEIFHKELYYGVSRQLGEKWGVAVEHRYDFETNELAQQTYQIRRTLHCWEGALKFRERREGWDVRFEMNIAAFPKSKISF